MLDRLLNVLMFLLSIGICLLLNVLWTINTEASEDV